MLPVSWKFNPVCIDIYFLRLFKSTWIPPLDTVYCFLVSDDRLIVMLFWVHPIRERTFWRARSDSVDYFGQLGICYVTKHSRNICDNYRVTRSSPLPIVIALLVWIYRHLHHSRVLRSLAEHGYGSRLVTELIAGMVELVSSVNRLSGGNRLVEWNCRLYKSCGVVNPSTLILSPVGQATIC